MRVRDLAGRLTPMDRHIAGFKMKRGKIPGKRFNLHRATRHLAQLSDHSLPDSLPEGAAVQINSETGHDNDQRQTGKDDQPLEFAFLRWSSGRRDVYIGFAAHGVPAFAAVAGIIRSMWACARK